MVNIDVLEQFTTFVPVTVDTLSEKLRLNMEMLKEQNVYEHTLYKKWKEIQEYRSRHDLASIVKAKIWEPSDINDLEGTIAEIEALQPTIRYISPENPSLMSEWLMLRIFISSAKFDQNPGRVLKFVIEDKVTGKYLGLSSISSDVIAMGARDKWIGWTKENRLDDGLLKNSAIGTCIVATQPLGYNFLGGKLIAALLTVPEVRDSWETVTENPLVGMSTTSLYGIHSMYNGIPYWKTLGETAGKIFLKPDEEIYKEFHHWLKEHHLEEYNRVTIREGIVGPVTGIKQKIITMMFQHAKLKPTRYSHGFSRGVFYCELYINSNAYLRGEIGFDELVIKPRIDKGLDGVVEWWKIKAIRRYTKLHGDGRLKPEMMYYDDMFDMTWEETKERYIAEIGR